MAGAGRQAGGPGLGQAPAVGGAPVETGVGVGQQGPGRGEHPVGRSGQVFLRRPARGLEAQHTGAAHREGLAAQDGRGADLLAAAQGQKLAAQRSPGQAQRGEHHQVLALEAHPFDPGVRGGHRGGTLALQAQQALFAPGQAEPGFAQGQAAHRGRVQPFQDAGAPGHPEQAFAGADQQFAAGAFQQRPRVQGAEAAAEFQPAPIPAQEQAAGLQPDHRPASPGSHGAGPQGGQPGAEVAAAFVDAVGPGGQQRSRLRRQRGHAAPAPEFPRSGQHRHRGELQGCPGHAVDAGQGLVDPAGDEQIAGRGRGRKAQEQRRGQEPGALQGQCAFPIQGQRATLVHFGYLL